MEIMGITSVAAITVICYVLALAIKATKLDNKWLPAICGVLGGLLGIVGMLTMPGFPAAPRNSRSPLTIAEPSAQRK